MTNILLCDDEAIVAKQYELQIKKLARKHEIPITVHSFTDGKYLLSFLGEEPNQVDIIYLDVMMDSINGIDLAKALRINDCNAEIIFLTSSEEYVFESFDVSPLDYLLKDKITSGEFEDIFLRAVQKAQTKEKECFVVEISGSKIKIPLNFISHFKVNNRLVTLYYNDTSLAFYSKLDIIESDLRSKGFIRTHRSFIVNCKFIEKLVQSEVFLSTGDVIPVSLANYKGVKQAFSRYLITG